MPITGITLIAGFASTVGWPATAWIEHAFGWREACLIWAAINLCIAMPLNLLAIPPAPPLPAPVRRAARRTGRRCRGAAGAMAILAFFFSATPVRLRRAGGALPRIAARDGRRPKSRRSPPASLVGPAQVGARIAEFGLLRSFHPLISARIASLLHPLGAALLVALGPAGAAAFAVLHGAGNGMITIAKGTLPLAIFGPAGYGQAQRHPVGPDPDRRGERTAVVRVAADRARHRGGPRHGRAVPIGLCLAVAAASPSGAGSGIAERRKLIQRSRKS